LINAELGNRDQLTRDYADLIKHRLHATVGYSTCGCSLQCPVGFGGRSWVNREVNLSVISDCKAPHKTAVSPQRVRLNHKSINRSTRIGPRCCVIDLIKLLCRFGVVTFRNRREAGWKAFYGVFSSIRIDRRDNLRRCVTALTSPADMGNLSTFPICKQNEQSKSNRIKRPRLPKNRNSRSQNHINPEIVHIQLAPLTIRKHRLFACIANTVKVVRTVLHHNCPEHCL